MHTTRAVDYHEEPGLDFWEWIILAHRTTASRVPSRSMIFKTSQTSLQPISLKTFNNNSHQNHLDAHLAPQVRGKKKHIFDFGVHCPFKEPPVTSATLTNYDWGVTHTCLCAHVHTVCMYFLSNNEYVITNINCDLNHNTEPRCISQLQ